MAADSSRKAEKVLNASFWSSVQKKTKATRNFSIKLLPTESTTGRRNEHKDSRAVLLNLKPGRSS